MEHSSRLLVLGSSNPSLFDKAEGELFSGHDKYLLHSGLAKAGLDPGKVQYMRCDRNPNTTIQNINSVKGIECILALGNEATLTASGESSVDKWNLSPLPTITLLNCPKVIPTFDFRRLNIQYDYRFFFFKAIIRASESLYEGSWKRKPKRFTLIREAARVDDIPEILSGHDTLSVDIETSNGTINTMGFAWSESDAVAIRCEPGFYDDATQFRLWNIVNNVLKNPGIKKILQNNIYEGTYFSRYGITMNNVFHDTMWAQKLLYPEFKQDLATIGRLYTNEIYWKEDNKDWNRIDNWERHLKYNCMDTTGTYEAAMNQRKELEERNLLSLYDDYLIKLAAPLIEMCSTGLNVNEALRLKTLEETTTEIDSLVKTLTIPINHRSYKHKGLLLESKGYKLPKKKNSKGDMTGSTDELALKKLRLKNPEDTDLSTLLKLAKLEKFKSSYLEFDYHEDGIVRYTLRGTGTETLRFAGGTDSWSMGFNPQTIPKKAKKLFVPPEGHYFMQVDLSQAESRYVAYKSRDYTLISMLEDPSQDVHSYVASNIFGVSVEEVVKEKNSGDPSKRQLGKKSGHGGNYAMAHTTFMDSCLKESDLVLTPKEAKNALEGYHRAFPQIRNWHRETRDSINNKGYLENALGFRRYFYGRRNDNTYREGYAFEPQSTIPMITNHLLLYLVKQRDYGVFDFNLHLQVHDSLILSCTEKHLELIMNTCKNTSLWHPKIIFPITGRMIIPVECEYGKDSLGDLTEYQP